MKTTDNGEKEVVFLFGQHTVDQAREKGPQHFVKRVNQRVLSQAARNLRSKRGPERARFAHSLDDDIAGALIHALLDSRTWDKLVLQAAVAKVPDAKSGRTRRRSHRAVRTRRFRTRPRLDLESDD